MFSSKKKNFFVPKIYTIFNNDRVHYPFKINIWMHTFHSILFNSWKDEKFNRFYFKVKSSEEDYSSIFMSLSNNHHRIRNENFIQSYCQNEKKELTMSLKILFLNIFFFYAAIELWPLRWDYEFTVIFYKDLIFFLWYNFRKRIKL